MALVLEGIALAVEGVALVIDCACCLAEKCTPTPCAADVDCDQSGPTACYCRKSTCTSNPACVDDTDCPDGYECENGQCVSICRGQPCTGDGDCDPRCECVENGCWNKDRLYYCWKEVEDENGNPIPPQDQTRECNRGKPDGPRYVQDGGPYLSYGICAQLGCDAKFQCNPVIGDCYPDINGPYDKLTECQKLCGDIDNDLGRCCESTVCYDADGEVISVNSKCAETGLGGTPCCGGQLEPIDPNNPNFGEKCVDTGPCRKGNCISDEPQPFPSCRTFRSFNSLFDNCDNCPSLGLGPCCVTDENGVETCEMLDKGECEDVRGGTWKGNVWWTCEDARDSEVDALLDFACPDCNGKGDCACSGDQYCHLQKCRDCNNPIAITNERFVMIDDRPVIGDKWEFRSRDCNDGVSTQDRAINIYGERDDGTNELLVSIDNSDVDSRGLTKWTNDSTKCFVRLNARMAVDEPPAVLCRERTQGGSKEPPANCKPIQVGMEGECECPGGPNCSGDNDDLASATYSWGPLNGRVPDGLIYKEESCMGTYKTEWWEEYSSQTILIPTEEKDADGIPCYLAKSSSFRYLRLLAYIGTTGWTDVTDDWIDSTTNADEEYTDLLRSEYYEEEEPPFFDGCQPSSVKREHGSEDVYQELYDVGCEKPDPLADCGGANFRSENPLP